MILPLLRDVLKNPEREVVLRAEQCIRRIEEEPSNRLPLAALRMLALRKPTGAAETLVAYLPFAEEEAVSEVQLALEKLAIKDGKPEPAVTLALTATRPTIRAIAAEVLAKTGGKDALPLVRKLLNDADLTVRLRTAMALAPRDGDAIPVLIGLIPDLQSEQAWQVHDFLSQLSPEQSPTPPQDTPEGRKKSSADWAAWWKDNAGKVDLSRLTSPQQNMLGYTLICEGPSGKVTELGRDRKPRWTLTGLQFPSDGWVLPNNRVLIAELTGNRVTERDMKGSIIWQKNIGSPVNVQRFANGNTFIVSQNGTIVEVDRNGKEVLNIPNLGSITAGYKTAKGEIFAILSNTCVRFNATGKRLHQFTMNGSPSWVSGIDVLKNGRILITLPEKVTEYDTTGKLHLEVHVNQITTATGLPNGNILAACHNGNRLAEVDRKGKVIWEHRGSPTPFRARGR
jgi:hypothetical protein